MVPAKTGNMIKVRSIPHIYRNVRRSTEILAVLSKYGLADWLSSSNIDFVKDRLSSRDGRPHASLATDLAEELERRGLMVTDFNAPEEEKR